MTEAADDKPAMPGPGATPAQVQAYFEDLDHWHMMRALRDAGAKRQAQAEEPR